VRVFAAKGVRDECSCSRAKIDDLLGRFTPEEIEESIEDGQIWVKCEFCGKRYDVDPESVKP
jgi:molecular chaperone Hsp33